MKYRILHVALVCITTVVSTGCSLAPLTPRVDAASIGKGEVKIEANFSPVTLLGIAYGVGEKLDIGLEVEQALMTTAWARYSFINNPNGFSFAGTGAVYDATGDVPSNGWYAGMLLSNQFEPTVRWTAGVRYAVLDYQYTLGPDNNWFSFAYDFSNPDDASHNLQVDLNISWLMKPHVELAVGASCQYLLKNEDPRHSDEYCYPVVGFSFYRR